MGTAAPALMPQLELLAKNFRPQFTFACVAITTFSMAVVTCDHFEQPVVLHLLPLGSSAIEPDLSWTIKMSGGSVAIDTLVCPQLMLPPVPVALEPAPPDVAPLAPLPAVPLPP